MKIGKVIAKQETVSKPKKDREKVKDRPEFIKGVAETEEIFSRIRKPITDKDLKNPAVGRMLLDWRDRLLIEKVDLESFKEEYYKADKRAGVLEEALAGQNKFTLLYTVTTTVGGAMIGASFSSQGSNFWLLFLIGSLLVGISILIHLFKQRK